MKAPRKAQVTRTYESLAAVHVDNRAVVTKATIERLVDVKYDASYDVILNAIGDDMNFSDMVKVLATLVVNSDVSAEVRSGQVNAAPAGASGPKRSLAALAGQCASAPRQKQDKREETSRGVSRAALWAASAPVHANKKERQKGN